MNYYKKFIKYKIKYLLIQLNYENYLSKKYIKLYGLFIVKNNGLNLKFLNYNLRNNIDIVSEAIKQNSNSLKFASEELKNNKQIILLAINKNRLVFQYASINLQNNKEFIIEAIKINPLIFYYINKKFQNNINIAWLAINKHNSLLKCIFNKNIILFFIKKNGLLLKNVHWKIYDNDIINEALSQNYNAIYYKN